MISYLISVSGKLNAHSSVREFVNWLFFASDAVPLYAGGKTGRFGSFKRNFNKLSIADCSVKGSNDAMCTISECEYEICISEHIGRVSQAPEVVVQVPCRALRDTTQLSEKLFELFERVDYGFFMPSMNLTENIWYAFGMTKFGQYEYHSQTEREIQRWAEEESRVHSRFSGRLRDVYPINFLGAAYPDLQRKILEWNDQNNQCLATKLVRNILEFNAPTFEVREKLRAYLRPRAKLICHYPFPSDGPNVIFNS